MPLSVDKAKQTMFKMDSILHLGKKRSGKNWTYLWPYLWTHFPNALKYMKKLTKLYKNSAAHVKIFIKE